jgi:MFS superfamily sulfate permease-like transporter
VLLYRVDGGLFYANTAEVKDDLERLIDAQDPPPKLVIFEMSSSPAVDLAAAEMLGELHEELAARGIALRLANVEGPVRDMLRRAGLEEAFGALGPDMDISAVVAHWRAGQQLPPASPA